MRETERRDQALLYHYGELEAAEAGGFEAHLAACRGCAALLADLRRTDALSAASGLTATDFAREPAARWGWGRLAPVALSFATAAAGFALWSEGLGRSALGGYAAGALEARLDRLDGRIGALRADLAAGDWGAGGFEARLDAVGRDLADLKNDMGTEAE